jgi:hypothetical protein
MPFIKILSTPKRAAREITKILINASGQTGVYYDEGGRPMRGSALVRDPTFQDRVVAETRAFPGRTLGMKSSSQLASFASEAASSRQLVPGCRLVSAYLSRRDPRLCRSVAHWRAVWRLVGAFKLSLMRYE